MSDYNKNFYSESLLYRFLRKIVKHIVMPWFRVECRNVEAVKKLEKPYIVLPNHSGFFDPFFINAPVPEKFHYVVSDTQFRSPFTRFLLGQTGAIPITKNTNDLNSLKKMTEASRGGRILGIFPEGLRNWDGKTLPLIESTAKLVRMLNVPVVVPLMEGAYLMDPRWGRGLRRGKVVITYKILFNGEKPGRMKIDHIVSVLRESLDHNEFTCEANRGVKFKGRRRAENIEQIIYLCPQCRSISSFRSKGNDFHCQSCGYSVHYTEEGHFKALTGKDYFDNMVQWNDWQKEEVAAILKKDHGEEPVFSDDSLIHSMPDSKGAFRKKGTGSLYFYKDKIEFRSSSGKLHIYSLDEITGINVQLHERLEFYYDRKLHRFHSRERRFSARKIEIFYKTAIDLEPR